MAKTRLLSTMGVAHILGCGDDRVRRLAKIGELDYTLDNNGRLLFNEDSVRRYAKREEARKNKNAAAA